MTTEEKYAKLRAAAENMAGGNSLKDLYLLKGALTAMAFVNPDAEPALGLLNALIDTHDEN